MVQGFESLSENYMHIPILPLFEAEGPAKDQVVPLKRGLAVRAISKQV